MGTYMYVCERMGIYGFLWILINKNVKNCIMIVIYCLNVYTWPKMADISKNVYIYFFLNHNQAKND